MTPGPPVLPASARVMAVSEPSSQVRSAWSSWVAASEAALVAGPLAIEAAAATVVPDAPDADVAAVVVGDAVVPVAAMAPQPVTVMVPARRAGRRSLLVSIEVDSGDRA